MTPYFKKEDRFEIRYISLKTGTEKSCYPRSVEKKDEQIAYCKEHGIRIISCKKLYPFSTMKNQHNFELIKNICFNRMHDMISGEIPMDDSEYERLSEMAEQAGEFFCLPLPVAWLPWEEYREANELAQMAIIHRQNACIANGRPDLVPYC